MSDETTTHEIRVWPILRPWPFGTRPFEVELEAGERIVNAETIRHVTTGQPLGIDVFIVREAQA